MQITEYFNVVSTNNQVFHFQLKGFWSEKFVEECGALFLKEFQSAVDSFSKEKFIVFADLSAFKSPGKTAKELIGQMMKYALDNGLIRAVELMPTAMQRMGIEQAAKKVDDGGFRVVVKEASEAIEIVEKLKNELLVVS